MTSGPPSADPNRVIASLARDQVNLDLKTVDLCFLAGLYLRADKAALASFEEDVLVDLFEQVCDVVHPGAETRASVRPHAIQRLEPSGRLLTVAEVAERLGVCRDTVYRMCDRGEIPHVRIANFLRVLAKDLEAFIVGRRQ